jgi:RsiW-degrading membrane proteinase PrsW (M82 family)
VRATAAGYLSVVPVVLLLALLYPHGARLGTTAQLLVYSFAGAGLLEEATKLGALRIATPGSEGAQRIQDGMRYGVLVGLGFAFVENLFYVSQPFTVVLLRSLTALPLHVSCAAVAGFYLAGFRLEGRRGTAGGLAMAALLHGLYDLALQQPAPVLFLAVVPLAGAIVLALTLNRRAATLDGAAGR